MFISINLKNIFDSKIHTLEKYVLPEHTSPLMAIRILAFSRALAYLVCEPGQNFGLNEQHQL